MSDSGKQSSNGYINQSKSTPINLQFPIEYQDMQKILKKVPLNHVHPLKLFDSFHFQASQPNSRSMHSKFQINLNKFCRAIYSVLNPPSYQISRILISDLFKKLDPDRSGNLNIDQIGMLVKASIRNQNLDNQKIGLEKFWKKLTNQPINCQVSTSDLKAKLTGKDINWSENQADYFLKLMDLEKSGKISFWKMLRSRHSPNLRPLFTQSFGEAKDQRLHSLKASKRSKPLLTPSNININSTKNDKLSNSKGQKDRNNNSSKATNLWEANPMDIIQVQSEVMDQNPHPKMDHRQTDDKENQGKEDPSQNIFKNENFMPQKHGSEQLKLSFGDSFHELDFESVEDPKNSSKNDTFDINRNSQLDNDSIEDKEVLEQSKNSSDQNIFFASMEHKNKDSKPSLFKENKTGQENQSGGDFEFVPISDDNGSSNKDLNNGFKRSYSFGEMKAPEEIKKLPDLQDSFGVKEISGDVNNSQSPIIDDSTGKNITESDDYEILPAQVTKLGDLPIFESGRFSKGTNSHLKIKDFGQEGGFQDSPKHNSDNHNIHGFSTPKQENQNTINDSGDSFGIPPSSKLSSFSKQDPPIIFNVYSSSTSSSFSQSENSFKDERPQSQYIEPQPHKKIEESDYKEQQKLIEEINSRDGDLGQDIDKTDKMDRASSNGGIQKGISVQPPIDDSQRSKNPLLFDKKESKSLFIPVDFSPQKESTENQLDQVVENQPIKSDFLDPTDGGMESMNPIFVESPCQRGNQVRQLTNKIESVGDEYLRKDVDKNEGENSSFSENYSGSEKGSGQSGSIGNNVNEVNIDCFVNVSSSNHSSRDSNNSIDREIKPQDMKNIVPPLNINRNILYREDDLKALDVPNNTIKDLKESSESRERQEKPNFVRDPIKFYSMKEDVSPNYSPVKRKGDSKNKVKGSDSKSSYEEDEKLSNSSVSSLKLDKRRSTNNKNVLLVSPLQSVDGHIQDLPVDEPPTSRSEYQMELEKASDMYSSQKEDPPMSIVQEAFSSLRESMNLSRNSRMSNSNSPTNKDSIPSNKFNSHSLSSINGKSSLFKNMAFQKKKKSQVETADDPLLDVDSVFASLLELTDSSFLSSIDCRDIAAAFANFIVEKEKQTISKNDYLETMGVIRPNQAAVLDYTMSHCRIYTLFQEEQKVKSDQEISIGELVNGLVMVAEGDHEAKYESLFIFYDRNGDGFLSQRELQDYFCSLFKLRGSDGQKNLKMSWALVQSLFNSIDQDHDGKISLEEYKNWMKKMGLRNREIALSKKFSTSPSKKKEKLSDSIQLLLTRMWRLRSLWPQTLTINFEETLKIIDVMTQSEHRSNPLEFLSTSFEGLDPAKFLKSFGYCRTISKKTLSIMMFFVKGKSPHHYNHSNLQVNQSEKMSVFYLKYS